VGDIMALQESCKDGGIIRANDVHWPTSNGKFMNYSRFKTEWLAYWQAYHNFVRDYLMAKSLREKCVWEEVRKRISNVEDLTEISDTLDRCYERKEKHMSKELKPITELRKYKMADCAQPSGNSTFYLGPPLRVLKL
jgi:hypothetical protein